MTLIVGLIIVLFVVVLGAWLLLAYDKQLRYELVEWLKQVPRKLWRFCTREFRRDWENVTVSFMVVRFNLAAGVIVDATQYGFMFGFAGLWMKVLIPL